MAKKAKKDEAAVKFVCAATRNGIVVIGDESLSIKGHMVVVTDPAHIAYLSRPDCGFTRVALDAAPELEENETTQPPQPLPTDPDAGLFDDPQQ